MNNKRLQQQQQNWKALKALFISPLTLAYYYYEKPLQN